MHPQATNISTQTLDVFRFNFEPTGAFEVTPEGVKADPGVQSAPASTTSTDRKLIYATFILVLLAVGFQIADRFLANQSDATLAGAQASDSSDSSTQVVRSTLPLGDLLPIQAFGQAYGFRTGLTLSADGSRFAYPSANGASHQIYIRDLDQLEPRPLGPPITTSLLVLIAMLSPDGEWVYYKNSDLELWKIPVNGGPAQFVTEGIGPMGYSYSFGEDGTVYFPGLDSTLRQLPASGGESQSLGIPSVADMNRQATPHILPKGEALLFTRLNYSGDIRIELFDLETQDSRILIGGPMRLCIPRRGISPSGERVLCGRFPSTWIAWRQVGQGSCL